MSEKPTYEALLSKVQEYEALFQGDSKLRSIEDALLSERKYRCLVESLERDYIIYSHDQDGTFTYLSPSVFNVLGYTQEQFAGHYSEYMTDSPVNQDAKIHTAATLRGEKQPPYEAEFWHKNGQRVYLRTTEVPIFDDNGMVVGVEGIVQDITELKRVEAERERVIKKLEGALSELRILRGILPICSYCKKIRDDSGFWEQVDVYLKKYSEADISHGICPECMKKYYPDDYEAIFTAKKKN